MTSANSGAAAQNSTGIWIDKMGKQEAIQNRMGEFARHSYGREMFWEIRRILKSRNVARGNESLFAGQFQRLYISAEFGQQLPLTPFAALESQ